jgi:outer membrane cobalamin receptor
MFKKNDAPLLNSAYKSKIARITQPHPSPVEIGQVVNELSKVRLPSQPVFPAYYLPPQTLPENVDKLINYNPSTSLYENINKASFTGGELGLKWKQGDLFISSEYAYVKTENKSNGLEIAYRPKETLTLTTGLENSVYGVSASLVARSHSNASNSANAVQVPGYATVDLNAYWNATQNVKLFTNIQNVGDVQYKAVYNYGSWYINGGRLATVGVTLNF